MPCFRFRLTGASPLYSSQMTHFHKPEHPARRHLINCSSVCCSLAGETQRRRLAGKLPIIIPLHSLIGTPTAFTMTVPSRNEIPMGRRERQANSCTCFSFKRLRGTPLAPKPHPCQESSCDLHLVQRNCYARVDCRRLCAAPPRVRARFLFLAAKQEPFLSRPSGCTSCCCSAPTRFPSSTSTQPSYLRSSKRDLTTSVKAQCPTPITSCASPGDACL